MQRTSRSIIHGVASLCCHPDFWRPLQCCSSARQSETTPKGGGDLWQGIEKAVQRRRSGRCPVRIGHKQRSRVLPKDARKSFPQDALHWRAMLCACVMSTQAVFARALSRVPNGNIVGCLTMARHMVSSQCNAALDAAYLR